MLLHSTLRLATIARDPKIWTRLYFPIDRGSLAGHELTKISAQEKGKFKVESSGTSLYLKGLFYEETTPAHITLTPNNLGEWTYFHFTLETKKRIAYYQLVLDDEELSASLSLSTVVDHEIKPVKTSAENYWKPKDVPAALTEDLIVILLALVEGARYTFEPGGVPTK